MAIKRYAIVSRAGIVQNVVLFDGKPPEDWGGIPKGHKLVAATAKVGPGWKHDGSEYTPPSEPKASAAPPRSVPISDVVNRITSAECDALNEVLTPLEFVRLLVRRDDLIEGGKDYQGLRDALIKAKIKAARADEILGA